jgi:hypothetical protein
MKLISIAKDKESEAQEIIELAAKQSLTDVVVLGYNKDEDFVILSSKMNMPEIYLMVNQARVHLERQFESEYD